MLQDDEEDGVGYHQDREHAKQRTTIINFADGRGVRCSLPAFAIGLRHVLRLLPAAFDVPVRWPFREHGGGSASFAMPSCRTATASRMTTTIWSSAGVELAR